MRRLHRGPSHPTPPAHPCLPNRPMDRPRTRIESDTPQLPPHASTRHARQSTRPGRPHNLPWPHPQRHCWWAQKTTDDPHPPCQARPCQVRWSTCPTHSQTPARSRRKGGRMSTSPYPHLHLHCRTPTPCHATRPRDIRMRHLGQTSPAQSRTAKPSLQAETETTGGVLGAEKGTIQASWDVICVWLKAEALAHFQQQNTPTPAIVLETWVTSPRESRIPTKVPTTPRHSAIVAWPKTNSPPLHRP